MFDCELPVFTAEEVLGVTEVSSTKTSDQFSTVIKTACCTLEAVEMKTHVRICVALHPGKGYSKVGRDTTGKDYQRNKASPMQGMTKIYQTWGKHVRK